MHSVLYVDDEESLLEVGKFFLEEKGDLHVDTASSAIDAMEKIRTGSYDAIVSDYQMPKMDGIEFLKQVRLTFGNIPFILFTGRGREEVVIQAINNGADFYLQKGGDPTSQFAELDHDIRIAVERRKAVDALVESEQRLADIINFLPDATFAIDTTGVVIAWNRAIENMTGIPADDMLGKGDHEYAIPFYDDRRPILIDLILETEDKICKRDYTITKKERDVLIAETAAAHPRGLQKILSGKASLLYNKKGEIAGAIESIRDITETKRAEEELRAAYEQISATEDVLRAQYDTVSKNEKALRESEKAYRTIFEHTGSATIQVEEDTTISIVNNTFEKLTGYNRQEIEGIRKWTEFVVREDLEKMVGFHQERRKPEGRPPELYEFRLITKQGEIRDILLTVGIIQGTKKTVATLFDLTERKKMELALRESEEKFRMLAETSIVGICVFRQKILYVNPAGVALTGYSSDEMLKMDFWSFIHPDFRDLVRDRGQRRQQGETVPSHYEVKIVRKDGGERWIDVSTTVFPYEGQPTLLGVQVDITERKMAELALHQASLVVENSPVVLFRWKAAEGWPVVYVSNNVIQFGYTPDELLSGSVSFSSIVYPEDLERVSAEVQENSANGVGQFTQEYRVVTKDGNIRWVDDRTVIERNSDGRITHYQGIVIDITQRKQAEQALRSSEENFRTLVENAPDAINIQTNNRFVYLNAAAVHLFGASSPQELLGTSAFDRIHPSFHERIQDRTRRLTVELKPVELIDEIFLKMDGTPVDVEVAAVPFRYGGENGALVFFRDVTRRKQAESELQAAYEQLTAAEDELRRQYRVLAENEKELRQSEARYRSVVEVQTEFISRFRPDGTHVFANDAYLRHFNIKREDLIGHRFFPNIPVEDRHIVRDHFRALTPDSPVATVIHRVILPDGSIRWHSWSDRAIFNDHSILVEYQSVGHDISEIKQAEETLREKESALRSMFDATPVGLALIVNRVFQKVNNSHCRITGYSEEEMNGESVRMLYPDDEEYLRIGRYVYDQMEKEGLGTEETRFRKKDGTIINILLSVNLVDPGNPAAGVIGTILDITDRKRAERELHESENKFATVFQSNPVSLTLVSAADGVFVDVNDAFLINTGYSRGEVIGKTSEERGIFADTTAHERMVSQLRDQREVHGMELRCRIKSGEIRTCLFSSRVIFMGGKPHILSTVEDITERKRAEEALQQVNRQLNLMTSITRHDLLNKIMAMHGYLVAAKKKSRSPEMLTFIEKLESVTKAMKSQIEFTRVYQNLGTHEPQWQCADKIISGMDIPSSVTLQSALQGVEVYADPLLEKVFNNLLDNSLRHGEKVTRISISCHRTSMGLVLVWEDNGVGVPAAEKDQIFERGFGKNNGLGLFLVREILTITGISVRETGMKGQGARFEIVVPEGKYRCSAPREG